jgi:adenylylsulfate kinase
MNSIYFQKKQSNREGRVLWFTGLSGSGKSTIAIELESILRNKNILSKILDGDILRAGLNNNLGFSEEDRTENIRRTAEVAKMFSDTGFLVIVAFITPTQAMRDLARSIIGNENFVDIYINSSLEICEKRDVKGLYLKARKGEINNFTGISSPYEVPICTDIEIDTGTETVEICINKLMDFLAKKTCSINQLNQS